MDVYDEMVTAGRAAERKVIEDAIGSRDEKIAAAHASIDALNARIEELEKPLDPGYLPGWGTPVWRDEFDGPTIDLTKWRVKDSGYEAQDSSGYFEADMATIRDGQLVLATRRMPTPKPMTNRYYATCYLTTEKLFSQRFGRWEARIRCLKPGVSRGIWPSFWLRDDLGKGENDVMEAVGTPCAHPREYPDDGTGMSQTMYESTGDKTAPEEHVGWMGRLSSPAWDWHTYACEWTPEGMQNYIDGVPTLRETDDWLDRGFSSKANIRITKFVGTDWAGHPNTTQTAELDEMFIDYVRVWALPS